MFTKMNKTILITGGAGFIGSNLAIKFKEKYPLIKIIAMDNLKRRGSELNIPRLKHAGITFVHGDIRNKEDFEEIEKFDLMIECSAEPSVMAGFNCSPSYALNTNLVGTLNCLEEVRKNNAGILFLSTSRVYPIDSMNQLNISEGETRYSLEKEQSIPGASEKGISEKFPLDGGRSIYGATKFCSEIMIQEYISSFGIKGVINRCGVIAGPWQMGKTDQGLLGLWVAKHFFKGELSYIGFGGEGKQVRDFLHIDDLFDIIDIQINNFNKFNGEVYNIGGGLNNSASLLELTKICEKIIGNRIKINPVIETRPADLKLFITDTSKVHALTGWFPRRDINTIIKDIVDWMDENKMQLKNILS